MRFQQRQQQERIQRKLEMSSAPTIINNNNSINNNGSSGLELDTSCTPGKVRGLGPSKFHPIPWNLPQSNLLMWINVNSGQTTFNSSSWRLMVLCQETMPKNRKDKKMREIVMEFFPRYYQRINWEKGNSMALTIDFSHSLRQ